MRESVPLLVSDFLLFKVFVLKFNKKAQSPNVPSFGVLSPVSWAPVYWVLSPASQVLDPERWVQGPEFQVLGCWVPDPGVLGHGYSF